MKNRTILPSIAGLSITGLLTPILFLGTAWADSSAPTGAAPADAASTGSISENSETIKQIPQTSGTAPAASVSGENSVVSGLTLLTGGGSTASPAPSTAPIEMPNPGNAALLPDGTAVGTGDVPGNAAAGEGVPAEGNAEGVPEGDMLFPGKIKDIKVGNSSVGTLSLTIRWFRPIDFGLPSQQGGKVRIERTENPEGEWKLVAPDAEGISTDQSGYWFAISRDRDSTPFYIRTVRTDPFGKEWMDMIPTPINLAESFDKKPAPVSNGESGTIGDQPSKNSQPSNATGSFVNASMEKNMPSYQPQMKSGGSNSAWNTPLNQSETDELTAALNQNHSAASPADTGSKSGSEPARKKAPKRAPTDPGQITLNPILTRGLSLFWNDQGRVDADYPGVNNPGDYPAPYSGSSRYIPERAPEPSTPPKRSIFMSPQEYETMLAEGGYAGDTNPRSTSGAIGSGGNYSGGVYNGGYNGMTANGSSWSPQEQPGTIYSSDAAMLNQGTGGMPSVIYEDANGNVIDNPFPNGQGTVMPDNFSMSGDMNGPMLSLPNGTEFSTDGFTNASFSDPYSGTMNGTVINGMGMNGPYTSQESTIGTTANYPGPVQQPLSPGVLPPKPGTK